MSDPERASDDLHVRYGEILEEWRQRLESGESLPDLRTLRCAHPELAERLLADLEFEAALDRPLDAEEIPALEPLSAIDPPDGFSGLELVGRGGMGVVYRCREEALGRIVCLKTLSPEHLGSPQSLARFRRESEIVARLDHPGIVKVHARSVWRGVPFFTMDWIEGKSLDRVLDLRRGDPAFDGTSRGYVRSCLEELRCVCEAIHVAHERGVVHRDLKPSNLVHDGQRLRILDFGLARDTSRSDLTATHQLLGSRPYMSPEQVRGAPVDRRSDIYSLGVTLYEMLTLQRPFVAVSELQLIERIVREDPPPLRAANRAVGRDLEAVVERALEKDPDRRYASAEELAEELGRILEERPVRARRLGRVAKAIRRLHRERRLLAAASALAAGVCLVAALVILGVRGLVRQAETRARLGAVLAMARGLPEAPILAPAMVRELVALYGRASGPELESVALVLAAEARARQRPDIAWSLLARCRLIEPGDASAGAREDWLCFRTRTAVEAGRRAEAERWASGLTPTDAAVVRPILEAAGRMARRRACPSPPCPSRPGRGWLAAALLPGDPEASPRLLAFFGSDTSGSRPRVLHDLVGPGAPRVEKPRWRLVGEPPEKGGLFVVHQLLTADLDADGRGEIWATATHTSGAAEGGARAPRLGIWRVEEEGAGGFVASRAHTFPPLEGGSSYARTRADAVRGAVLPVPGSGEARPVLVVGTASSRPELSLFTLEREGGRLVRHPVLAPDSDVDSVVVVDPDHGSPRLVVHCGKHRAYRTSILEYEPGRREYALIDGRPVGLVYASCRVRAGGGDRVLLATGQPVVAPHVFGTRRPSGPSPGVDLLDPDDPGRLERLRTFVGADTFYGFTARPFPLGGGREAVYVAYRSPERDERKNAAAVSELFVFSEGRFDFRVPVPGGDSVAQVVPIDRDRDGATDFLVALGFEIVIHDLR